MKIIEQLLKDRFDLQVDDDLQYDKSKIQLTKKFLQFCSDELGLYKKFTCKIVSDRKSNGLTTLAYYMIGDGLVVVYGKDRMLGDIMRSIAHELTHHKQFQEDRLNDPSVGDDGTEIENEANAVAGVIMRKFGKKHQEIYQ